MQFYAIWNTSNGQQQWDGPYSTQKHAEAALRSNMHARANGGSIAILVGVAGRDFPCPSCGLTGLATPLCHSGNSQGTA